MPDPFDLLSPSRTSGAVVALTVGALALTGCSAEEEPVPPIAEPEPTGMLEDPDPLVEPEDDASPGPTPTDGTADDAVVSSSIDVPDLQGQCFVEPGSPQVERVTYSVPPEWQVAGSCEVLDPELEELPEDTDTEAAIVIDANPAAYGDVAAPGEAEQDVTTWVGARSGYQAQRRSATSTGAALLPEGTPVLRWMVDLDLGADEDGGTFTITTSSEDEQVRAVADAIAETTVIQPPADRQAENNAPESLAAVLVQEGGGRPFAVTFDGDCFAYRPGGADQGFEDQECGMDPTEAPIVARVLGEDVLVGFAPAASVAVEAPGLDSPYGIAANVEGGTVFAFPVDELPTELTALGKGGEELVTTAVG